MRAFSLVALVASFLCTNVLAVVIVDQNVSLTTPGYFAEYELTVLQDEAFDHTAVFFDVTETNVVVGTSLGLEVTYRETLVDEGSFWYLVNCDDPLRHETVNNGVYYEVFGSTNLLGQATAIPYGEFILGIATRQDHLDDPDIFGWARMDANQDGITLLGSAMAYDEIGINACSVVAIPEPDSTMSILFAGVPLFLSYRRRH